jgi:aspartate ammonia-lyase
MRGLTAALDTLTVRCIRGITANRERCRALALNSIGVITALNPILGYEVCSRVAKTALETGRGVVDIVLEERLLSEEQVATLLKPENMTQPGRAQTR